jgi:Predicted xylanase/chitin deacetylase
MKKILTFLIVCTAFVSVLFSQNSQNSQNSWIRINQLGYLPNDTKVAVFIANIDVNNTSFSVFDVLSGDKVFEGVPQKYDASKWAMKSGYRLDFSKLNIPGGYYIVCGDAVSPTFKIADNVYEGLSDYMLTYMRQQRCGYNPYNDTLCHQHDGYIVDHPTRNGEKIDVRGGWHDATDYLQYQTTSATATYHLLFAYMEQKDKSIFKDNFDARGKKGKNGIPDILDEARWGLEWLVKMNPEDKVMFAQIADDRDHAGFRLPYRDKVDYGWGAGTGRPVYFVTGKPQGLGKWINRTTGVASVAGKFSSSFALGSVVFEKMDPKFSNLMKVKSEQAYRFAEENPGNTQTACLVSPYFYEEDTYTDDVELAASTIYNYSGDEAWIKKADYWGELEPVSPWMELGRGRHYQYYPFINLGHYYLSKSSNDKIAQKYKDFMKQGLNDLYNRAKGDPFMNGIPYIWCSNNLVSAAITQARLYNKVTGDSTYVEMEAALRDWLFGCNPWGTSMIVGLPEGGDYPDSPHSSYLVVNGDNTYGGLVDGPVYKTVFEERAGNSLRNEDLYKTFNNGIAVYHDDCGDYASNEPTMDGTAGLTYYFAAKENEGLNYQKREVIKDNYGAIIRVNPKEQSIFFVFTADSMFQGGEKILKTLAKEKIKASFFLTGNCLRLAEHENLIKKIIKEGHYVGGHSDGHLLYAPWGNRDSSLFTSEQIIADAVNNMKELNKFGIKSDDAKWFLPPYEYYNKLSINALENAGFKVVNYTPGIATPADYTIPSMSNYQPTQKLIDKLYQFEMMEGLNGALVLIHPGVQDERSDKLYNRLGEIIKYFKAKGYSFKSFKDL